MFLVSSEVVISVIFGLLFNLFWGKSKDDISIISG